MHYTLCTRCSLYSFSRSGDMRGFQNLKASHVTLPPIPVTHFCIFLVRIPSHQYVHKFQVFSISHSGDTRGSSTDEIFPNLPSPSLLGGAGQCPIYDNVPWTPTVLIQTGSRSVQLFLHSEVELRRVTDRRCDHLYV